MCPVFPSLYLGTNDSFILNKGMSSSLDGLGKNNINLLQGAHVFHTENSIIIPILNKDIMQDIWYEKYDFITKKIIPAETMLFQAFQKNTC